jgi:NAD(P)H-dependent flavin oxidoreductase YrpB (nitropropane dioxygenase family)
MKTRVTELLGCKYPILQGAMAGFGDWKLAAAVANTGAHGTITASISRTPEKLREDIRQCRRATQGSFGVNLSFGLCPRIEEMLEVCIEEKVPIETAMYKPDSLAARIVASGLPWIHKSARVKDAVHAVNVGAKAVIIVGLEGTGFKSPDQLPTITTMVWSTRQIKVPIIAAGGIADAHGFVGALGMGAEGIMMGTAFMLTRESPLKQALKEEIIKTSPDDPRLIRRVLGSVDPQAYAEAQAMRGKVPLNEWLGALERVNLKDNNPLEKPGSPGQKPVGDSSEAVSASDPTRLVSLALAGIDHIPSVKELVENIVNGAEEILDRLERIRS